VTPVNTRADSLVGRAATTAIVTCLLLVAGTVGAIAWPRLAVTLGVTPAGRAAPYVTGQTIDVPADWYRTSPHTLVLFARAGCSACQAAQPFFKQLVTDLKGRATMVLVSSSDDRERDAEYGRGLGLKDPAIQVTPGNLKVELVPTLVLVNQRGEILGAWEGVGPADQQATVAKAIARAIGL
jgi:hypothetical protein